MATETEADGPSVTSSLPEDDRIPRAVRDWAALFALTAVLAGTSLEVRVPGALLISSLVAAIAIALRNDAMAVPKLPYELSQGLLACFVARALSPQTVIEFGKHAPIFLLAVVATATMSMLSGTLLARRGSIPMATAIFGSFPGAAPAMVLMAEASNADPRLVAVMQYSRIVLVAITTASIGFVYLRTAGVSASPLAGFGPMDLLHVCATMLFATIASLIGDRSGVSAGAFLVPLTLAFIVSGSGLFAFALPGPMVVGCFVLVGWSIGLQFDRASFRLALFALPRILISVLLLMTGCLAVALAIAAFTGMDLMTAYLATSPGGLDAAVIIASGAHANLPFVVSLQATRLAFVLFAGPPVARWIVNRTGGEQC